MYVNHHFKKEPRANKELIQLAASKVNFPLTRGESSDRRTSNEGDIHPTEQPWANTITLAGIVVYKNISWFIAVSVADTAMAGYNQI